MIYRTLIPFLNHESSMALNENYTDRIEIIEKIYLDRIYTSDASKGDEIKQEIIFVNDFYNDEKKIMAINITFKTTQKPSILFFSLLSIIAY